MNDFLKDGKELFKHLNQYVAVDWDEFEEINSYFELKAYKKKDFLFRSGDLCKLNHFVVKGCAHMFFVDDSGTDRTVQFAIENWWITDHLAFQKEEVTGFHLQVVEDAMVMSIDKARQEELLLKHPQLEKYFRTIYQIAYGASLMKMKYLFGLSKKEIYFHFVDHFPGFAQRVPQYLIASFLNLTPEYVSEIRSQKRS